MKLILILFINLSLSPPPVLAESKTALLRELAKTDHIQAEVIFRILEEIDYLNERIDALDNIASERCFERLVDDVVESVEGGKE